MGNLKFQSTLTVVFAAVHHSLNICMSAINGSWKRETWLNSIYSFPLCWLMASKNATVGGDLNFRFCMLLKSATNHLSALFERYTLKSLKWWDEFNSICLASPLGLPPAWRGHWGLQGLQSIYVTRDRVILKFEARVQIYMAVLNICCEIQNSGRNVVRFSKINSYEISFWLVLF